jgi:hypothetical protein
MLFLTKYSINCKESTEFDTGVSKISSHETYLLKLKYEGKRRSKIFLRKTTQKQD